MYISIILIVLTVGSLYSLTTFLIPTAINLNRLRKVGVTTKASIFDYRVIKSKSENLYAPIVRFRMKSGKEVSIEIAQNMSKKKYNALPEVVDVIYLEDKIDVCYLSSQKPHWGIYGLIIFEVVGPPLTAYFFYKRDANFISDTINTLKDFF